MGLFEPGTSPQWPFSWENEDRTLDLGLPYLKTTKYGIIGFLGLPYLGLSHIAIQRNIHIFAVGDYLTAPSVLSVLHLGSRAVCFGPTGGDWDLDVIGILLCQSFNASNAIVLAFVRMIMQDHVRFCKIMSHVVF